MPKSLKSPVETLPSQKSREALCEAKLIAAELLEKEIARRWKSPRNRLAQAMKSLLSDLRQQVADATAT